jgi:LmbE family N-acetylglucosaminyl deacetylase
VAHPDDETLWAGGTLLLHPDCRWTVVTLTRKGDPDRAPRFAQALAQLGAAGVLGDLDDGPAQRQLDAAEVEGAILDLLPARHYDLVLTHGLGGEYTRHRRHEEVAAAVLSLRESGRLSAGEIWMFAYADDGGRHLPRPVGGSNIYTRLPEDIWKCKYRLITDVYGFAPDSFEARTTPRHEAFWIV